MTNGQITVSRELLRQTIDLLDDMLAPGATFSTDALRAALEQPAVEPVAWVKTIEQYPPESVRVFWFNPQHNQVGYDTWMGENYKFNAEYWMHIPGIGPAPQPAKHAPCDVHPRHPVVVRWRNDGIEACAGIADAYGNADAARDMRAMLKAAPQPQQPVSMLTQDDRDAVRLAAEQFMATDINGSWGNALISATEAAVRQKAGLK